MDSNTGDWEKKMKETCHWGQSFGWKIMNFFLLALQKVKQIRSLTKTWGDMQHIYTCLVYAQTKFCKDSISAPFQEPNKLLVLFVAICTEKYNLGFLFCRHTLKGL